MPMNAGQYIGRSDGRQAEPKRTLVLVINYVINTFNRGGFANL